MRAATSFGWFALLAVVSALCLTTPARAQDCDGWWGIGDPSSRNAATMVLDTQRNVVVLYGGNSVENSGSFNANNASTETWEFDGKRWRFRTLAGPSVRANYAIAYDPTRGVTVLFGGIVFHPTTNAFAGSSAETWEWDGSAWTQRSIPGPSARNTHAMAYDPVSQRVVLYGGTAGASEMWSYDGVAWTQIPQAPVWPGSRTGHAMCTDPIRSVIVLHSVGQPVMEWDGGEWSTPAPDQVLPTHAAILGFDSSTNKIVASTTNGGVGSFARWDGMVWTSVPGNVRVPTSHRFCQLPGDAGLMTYGMAGIPTTFPSQVNGYRFANSAIEVLPRAVAPVRRELAGLAAEPPKARTLLCGGTVPSSPPVRDTWELRGERWKLIDDGNTPGGPTSLPSPGLIYDEARDEMLLFGQGVWRRTPTAWQRITQFGFAPVQGTGYSPTHGPLVFGSGNLARWTGTTFVAFGSGIENTGVTFTFDVARGKGIALGTPGSTLTRTFDPSTLLWSILIQQTQTSTYSPGIVYDPSRGGVVLFGGFQGPSNGPMGAYQNRTYFLASDAIAWQELPLRGPMGRKRHSFAYDPVSDRSIIFGGLGLSTGGPTENFGDTWILSRGPAAIVRQAADAGVRPGRETELFVIAKGGGPITYQWRRDGEVIHDSDRFVGTDRDTLTVFAAEEGDEGEFTCTVTNACGAQTSEPAALTVFCAADVDDDGEYDNRDQPDGAVTIEDLLYFIVAFEAGDISADVDNGSSTGTMDYGVNIDDLLYFLVRFEQGC